MMKTCNNYSIAMPLNIGKLLDLMRILANWDKEMESIKRHGYQKNICKTIILRKFNQGSLHSEKLKQKQ